MEEELAPLLGERDGAGEFVFPRPPSAAIDTLLLGCTHYPLLRPVLAAAVGDRVAHRRLGDGDRVVAGGAAVGERARGARDARGTAADPGRNGHDRPTECVRGRGVHVQLTTGDVERFRSIASRMFGESFPDVEAVELAGVR